MSTQPDIAKLEDLLKSVNSTFKGKLVTLEERDVPLIEDFPQDPRENFNHGLVEPLIICTKFYYDIRNMADYKQEGADSVDLKRYHLFSTIGICATPALVRMIMKGRELPTHLSVNNIYPLIDAFPTNREILETNIINLGDSKKCFELLSILDYVERKYPNPLKST